MNVSESSSVFKLLAWVGHFDPPGAGRPNLAEVAEALGFLGERAGRVLQLPQHPDEIAAAVVRFAGDTGACEPGPALAADGPAPVSPEFYGAHRAARPGERCTCGRPAVVVHHSDESEELGYCGRAGAAQLVPCVFCGAEARHRRGRCPAYRLTIDRPEDQTDAGYAGGRTDRSVA